MSKRKRKRLISSHLRVEERSPFRESTPDTRCTYLLSRLYKHKHTHTTRRLLRNWGKSPPRKQIYRRSQDYRVSDLRGPSNKDARRVQPPLLRSKKRKSYNNTIDLKASKHKAYHHSSSPKNTKSIAVRTSAASRSPSPIVSPLRKQRRTIMKSFSPPTTTITPELTRKRKLQFQFKDEKTPTNTIQRKPPTVTPDMNTNLFLASSMKKKSSFVSRSISSSVRGVLS